MRIQPRLALAAAGTVAAALAAGCGTTVPEQQQQASGGSGLTAGSSLGPGVEPPAAGGGIGGADTSAGGPAVGQPTGPAASPPPAGQQPAATGAGRPLKPREPLRVGLMYSSDANAVVSSFGGAFSEPDYKALQNIVVAYVNKTGGVGGHPLVPEYYDASQTKSAQQISEEACASWVQDNHVQAAVPGLAVIDTSVLSQCLNRSHVVTVYEGSYSTLDAKSFAGLPYWFEPDTLSLNELASVYARALGEQGVLRGARVGLVYDTYPQFAAVAEKVLIPAIRAAGGNVVSTFQQSIHGTSDIASGSSAMNSAVLQFRSNNVSTVMFFDAWVGAWIDFAIAAQSQSWQPKYALSSQDGPQDSVSTGLVPPDQLPGTVFAGWYAVDDVPPGDAGNWARRSTCIDVFRRAGTDVTALSTDGYGAAMSMCSGLLILQDAGREVPGTLTPSALAGAVARLGQRLVSATVPAVRFGTGRQYGVAGWRPGTYVESCSCFRYTGPIHAF